MAIKIEMLRCFNTVAEAGNLSEAAARLGRTSSAISMTLKQLEEHLGQRLFESDRKNRLTPLGEQVFDLARAELRQFDQTIRAIETSASAPRGLIRIASVPSVAGLIFPTIVKTFTDYFPGIKIELIDTDSRQVIDAMTRGQADIGIASPQHTLNGITQTPLFSDRFGLICSPKHPLAHQKLSLTIEDVVAANFIRNDLCQSIEVPGFQAVTAEANLSARNTLSLIAMVRSENWVTILPKAVVHIAPSGLVFREISDLPDLRQVKLLQREKSPFRRYTEKLGDIILETDWSAIASSSETK